jgi:hypothetical protein
MNIVEFLGYILYVLFFILVPISLIGVGYIAISEFLETFKTE